MAIDPAGRGPDETSFAIVKMYGNLYVHACGGIHGGYEKDVLQKLANLAKEHSVNSVLVESNFGDGMWTKLFTLTYIEHIQLRLKKYDIIHKKKKNIRCIRSFI